MVVTILVALTVAALIAYLSLRKKETKPEIKHVIADVEPVEFEELNESNMPEPTFTAIAVEENNKLVKKPKTTAAKKPSAKKTNKNGK